MARYRFLIYLFVNCIIWLKSNGQAFDNICSKHPTIVGSRTDNQNDRSAFYIASHEDPRYQYRYSIQADRNSRFGSNLHIRAAILRATNQDNVIIGSWDTLNSPFIEQFCNRNDSSGDDISVAVMSGYTYPISSLEAVWVPPAFKVASPVISGFVYDSKRRVHRLDAVPALNVRAFFP
ncbi:hypothetical protein GJ496_009999 [Pomphorhynchus laevis]|nr:hypothetical protein GJ496_009999 [Pomphorhynchus laevis]